MSLLKLDKSDSLKDLHQVRDYMERLNRSVQFVFHSIDPDDNFSEEELRKYKETKKNLSSMEISAAGFQSLQKNMSDDTLSQVQISAGKVRFSVSKGTAVSSLNLERGKISLKGNRLQIATQNFVVTDSQAVAKGKITAESGNIAGWTIRNQNGDHSWEGSTSSRIKAGTIVATEGSAGRINAKGNVTINARVKGNFGEINCKNAKFSNGFSCSAMAGNQAELYCNGLYCYTTYREADDVIPSSPSHPSGDEQQNPKRYNTNDMPYGGLVCEEAYCKKYYSKLAGITYSDIRIKENVRDITEEESVELLKTVRPVTFTWREDGNEGTGFIAQELPLKYRTEKNRKKNAVGAKYCSVSATLDVCMDILSRRVR